MQRFEACLCSLCFVGSVCCAGLHEVLRMGGAVWMGGALQMSGVLWM
jgi:hypothetical protein